MFSNFSNKLDKKTCSLSLILISAIAFLIVIVDIYSLFDISGVFKQ